MCGVPHHAARGYLARLTEQGFKVVVVEQVEDPKLAKGLVKREVVQIVTPGVVVDGDVLEPGRARYLAAVVPSPSGDGVGLAHLDASTGELRATWVAGGGEALVGELVRIGPREILVRGADRVGGAPLAELGRRVPGCAVTAFEPPASGEVAALLDGLALDQTGELEAPARDVARAAAAACVAYARGTQPAGTLPLARLQIYRLGDAVVLDETAIINLELTETILPGPGGRRQGSLLEVLDQTVTAPGARLLRRWLLYPLVNVAPIRRRQDAVEHLVTAPIVRERVRAELGRIHDLERLAGRASLGVASPRDMGQLRASLAHLPRLCAELEGSPGRSAAAELPELLHLVPELLAQLREVEADLARVLIDEPPPMLKDGGLIRDGFCEVVDENRRLADGGKDAILAIEARERERTGISTLRVRYNRVFGYYLEVSQEPARPGARRVRAQADRGHRRALRHPRAGRARGQDPGRAGDPARARDRAVPPAGRPGRGPHRRALARPRPRWPPSTCARPWPRSATAAAGSGRWSTTATSSRWSRAATRWWRRAWRRASSCPTTAALDSGVAADLAGHRPQHGRQVDLPAAGGAHRAAGADGRDRAGALGPGRPGRSDLHPGGRGRQPGPGRVHLHGRDARDRRHPGRRDPALAGGARRGRPRHLHLRRAVDRVGGHRVPARRGRLPHAVRHPLPRALRHVRQPAAGGQPAGRRARGRRAHRVPAPDRPGRGQQELRHRGRAAGRVCRGRCWRGRARCWPSWRADAAWAGRAPSWGCSARTQPRRGGARPARTPRRPRRIRLRPPTRCARAWRPSTSTAPRPIEALAILAELRAQLDG